MSEKKAKALRKMVYGDGSRRTVGIYGRLKSGQIINVPESLRAIYQAAKRAAK